MNSKEMLEQEKENLLNGLISEELIYACLVTCEKTISTYAYKEKKYGNRYYTATVSGGESYKEERIKWMEYREKLRSLLLDKHPMREIIQNTKSKKVYTDKVSQKMVKLVIGLIDTGKYVLLL